MGVKAYIVVGCILFLVLSMPLCFAQEMALSYDANGNLVTGDGKFRTYNSLNQLWRVYNGSNSSGILLQEYTYDSVEERVLVKKTYNNTDNLGSTTVITNSSGNIIENTSYSPYGEVLTGGAKENKLYTGQYKDMADQYYYGARYYKPSTGQFEQADMLISNVYLPQSLNRYSYVDNNPYRYNDPTGHCPDCIVMMVGFALNSINYMSSHEGSGIDHVWDTYGYGAAGALEAEAAFRGGYIGAGVGAAIGRGIERKIDKEPLNTDEAMWEYLFAAGVGVSTKGIGENILPEARGYKSIKYLSSWAKKSGQLFITNMLIENAISTPANAGAEWLAHQIADTRRNTSKKGITPQNAVQKAYTANTAHGCTAIKNNRGGYNYAC